MFSTENILVDTIFYGASCNAVFGRVKLDLSNASIVQDIVVDVSAIFGSVDIIVPDNVKVKTSNIPIFGAISNKYNNSEDLEAHTIYINSTCMFGGVDIK